MGRVFKLEEVLVRNVVEAYTYYYVQNEF
jgi:hypothetical protein